MKTVLLIGTLDTKGKEYQYVRERLKADGVHALVMDVSLREFRSEYSSEVSCAEVARTAGMDIASMAKLERVPALKAMTQGAIKLAEELFRQDKFQGMMALGGSNGTAIACAVMQRFPFGMPKLMISTMASGDVRAYVGCKDILMFFPVGDISLNRLTRRILGNAAGAMAGMLKAKQIEEGERRIQIAITVFGVVQPCAERAKALLEAKGYEVVVFHTSGTGGMALEESVSNGEIDAVLDISTTELADEAVGGVLSAGPHRLEAAGAMGIPQVVIPGAIDLVNFHSPGTVPEKWKDRVFYRHTPHITLMRTNVAESGALGLLFAEKLNRATGPAMVLIPLLGFSAYDSPKGPEAMNLKGGPASRQWFWPEADREFYQAVGKTLNPAKVRYDELPLHINESDFAKRAVQALEAMIEKSGLHQKPASR